jgi:hypothetical protein
MRSGARPFGAQARTWPRVLLLTLSGCASLAPVATPPAAPAALSVEAAPPATRSPFEEPRGAYSPAVDQANITTTICVSWWTATVRPPTSYTQALKRKMLESQGIA